MNEPHDHRALDAALRALADDDRQLCASPHVQARVLAEALAIGASRRRAVGVRYAAAAALIAAVTAGVWTAWRPAPGESAEGASGSVAPSALETTEFFPLFYSRVPASGVHVVRVEVSREALATFGVEAFQSSGSGSRTVLADVVVGNDGLARAIRFVNP